MIATPRQISPEAVETRRRLHRARHVVASTFFRHDSESMERVPPISAWRAWLFAGWVVLVTAVYLATMLGLL